MSSKDSPTELHQRAENLRACARRGRILAGRLDGLLDGDIEQAGPETWFGPFADTSTGTLKHHRSVLRRMGKALHQDAKRWDDEADALADRARKARHRTAH